MSKYQHTQKHYAEREKCTVRTIRSWMKLNAPLDDPDKLASWKAARKSLPPGTQQKLNSAKAEARAEALLSSVASLPKGAAAALERLEEFELQAFKHLQQAIASGDPSEIKLAREGWLKTGESLRRYDLIIEQSRRLTGQLIPREDIEAQLRNLGTWVRLIGHQYAATFALKLVNNNDVCAITNVLREAFSDIWINAVIAKSAKPGYSSSTWSWVSKALLADERQRGSDLDEVAELRIKTLKLFCDYAAARIAQKEVGGPAPDLRALCEEHGLPYPSEENNQESSPTTTL